MNNNQVPRVGLPKVAGIDNNLLQQYSQPVELLKLVRLVVVGHFQLVAPLGLLVVLLEVVVHLFEHHLEDHLVVVVM